MYSIETDRILYSYSTVKLVCSATISFFTMEQYGRVTNSGQVLTIHFAHLGILFIYPLTPSSLILTVCSFIIKLEEKQDKSKCFFVIIKIIGY